MPYIPKILIVDDEPHMCNSLKALLSSRGHEIHICNSGREAIESLSTNNFDLVLLDMVMPDIDGNQIMDHIEAQCPDTLFIVITGYVSTESALSALRHRAYDYLRKPFEAEALLKTVDNALEQKKLSSEHKRAEEELRETARRLKLAYDQSLIYARELKEEMMERKRAGEALTRAKEDWENTFDAITDMVMLLDNKHHILRINKAAAEALRTTKNKLLGKKCYQVIHEQGRPIRGCPLVLTMKTLRPQTSEITEPHLGGTFICSTSPILDRQGKLTGYTHTLKDITKSKRLEAQFQQAQKMEAIGTLAGGIAHDFNNLLMGAQGNISLILLDIDSSHAHYERLKSIEKQIQSGAKLTSLLLGYARKGKYDVTTLNLNQLVKDTSDAFGRTRKGITIHLGLADDLSTIKADHVQIEQVLLNLFINAADAMPSGGNLILETLNVDHNDMKGKLYDPKPGTYVLLRVTDTGMGMDKKTLERIFEPFFTTKEMGRGTGLGLASVYGIIKGHGGYVDVDSQEKHGATFSVFLPASGKRVRKPPVKTVDRVIKGAGTVLLVDDEEIILEVSRDLLGAMGYRVLLAQDGKEALEVFKKNKDVIDIVILDMVMPNMGGGEAYDRMKEIKPEIKVLLSSGFSVDGEATDILERGCDGFIQKPFTMKELSAKIRKILEKK